MQALRICATHNIDPHSGGVVRCWSWVGVVVAGNDREVCAVARNFSSKGVKLPRQLRLAARIYPSGCT